MTFTEYEEIMRHHIVIVWAERRRESYANYLQLYNSSYHRNQRDRQPGDPEIIYNPDPPPASNEVFVGDAAAAAALAGA